MPPFFPPIYDYPSRTMLLMPFALRAVHVSLRTRLLPGSSYHGCSVLTKGIYVCAKMAIARQPLRDQPGLWGLAGLGTA
eukprot:5654377-Amphidinium_carterae.1